MDQAIVTFVYSEDEVTAVFRSHDSYYDMYGCYAHVGQHSGCVPEWATEQRLATVEEYAPLLKELQSIGYDVTINQSFELVSAI